MAHSGWNTVKGVQFLSKMVYKRVRGWTMGHGTVYKSKRVPCEPALMGLTTGCPLSLWIARELLDH